MIVGPEENLLIVRACDGVCEVMGLAIAFQRLCVGLQEEESGGRSLFCARLCLQPPMDCHKGKELHAGIHCSPQVSLLRSPLEEGKNRSPCPIPNRWKLVKP